MTKIILILSEDLVQGAVQAVCQSDRESHDDSMLLQLVLLRVPEELSDVEPQVGIESCWGLPNREL